MTNLKVFTGNANPKLSREIADYLGLDLGLAEVKTFSDGEINVMLGENVRGMDVFVIQPTSTPANINLMELLVMLDTMRRSSAKPSAETTTRRQRPSASRAPSFSRFSCLASWD